MTEKCKYCLERYGHDLRCTCPHEVINRLQCMLDEIEELVKNPYREDPYMRDTDQLANLILARFFTEE